MTTSTPYSVRVLILAGLAAAVMGTFAAADDPFNRDWNDHSDSCSSCSDGLFTPCYCGMSPLAACTDRQWYFTANVIALRRDAAQNEVFQTRNVNTLTSQEVFDADGESQNPRVFTLESSISRQDVLGTKDLHFRNNAGYRLLLGRKLTDISAVEFSYFDLNDWNETGGVNDATVYDVTGTIDQSGIVTVTDTRPNSLFSAFSGFGNPTPIEVFDYNSLATISYRSSVDNVELNVRHRVLMERPSHIAVSVLWGGRYNAVREQFRYFSTSATPVDPTTNTVNLRTTNDLWGFQIGGQIDLCWDPGWHTEFEIKGGVALNRAVLEGSYNIQDEGGAGGSGGLVNYSGRVDKDVTSWTGEMRLTMVYQFGQHLTTHVGYEALILSEIALASRNFETDLSILANGPWAINNGGSVVFHGPSAGFTFAW